jgi:membrane protein DedA with SNARE-associated domain/pimeloyl-ACP methyl ester carboxylesterase
MTEKAKRKLYQRRWLWVVCVYLLLLAWSGVHRFRQPEKPFPAGKKAAELSAIAGEKRLENKIRLAYQEFLPPAQNDPTPIILIHGSPGDSESLEKLGAELGKARRVIIPDLPGFGDSTGAIPDYSFRAHAVYLLELAEELKMEKFDALGFSMGGGVVLSLDDLAPGKLRSATFVSSIGVQEYELLGEYHVNHALHGLQLGLFRLLQNFTPHFGVFDGMMISYCRNFYDSDQRPLRGFLQRINVPFLIVHGAEDPLVPVEAAREHARLVPQSEYHEFSDENHFYVFMRPQKVAPLLNDFLSTIENGTARTRADAEPKRIAEAAEPFEPTISEAQGATAFVFFLLLAVATLVSEDLTCIAAGVLAAQGRISLTLAVLACFFGIWIGDLILFLVGRWFGAKALKRAPLKWFISEESVTKGAKWFQRRGALAIFLSRFTPSLRLPMYLGAGMLGMSFLKFAFWSALAVALWTPVLVYLAARLGAEAIEAAFINGQNVLWKLILAFFVVYFLLRFLLKLTTWKGRRLALGRWKRRRHWEFWSMRLFYPPVLVYIAWLMLKHRSLTIFTCANPGIEASGFVGESKKEIYDGLRKSAANAQYLLKFTTIPLAANLTERMETARLFIGSLGYPSAHADDTDSSIVQADAIDNLSAETNVSDRFPVALKPNAGERGKDTFIIKSEAELELRLAAVKEDSILQEFARGAEFGVFYYRYPNQEKGRIFAITEKIFPAVTGDGVSTLETLILSDDRAICLAQSYLERNKENLEKVLSKGETYPIIDIGTHSKGAIFLDGMHLRTPELEAKIDEICRRFEGFYFGRFDLRVPSREDFQRGENLKIIELNGVTSEATSIYDPKNSVLTAWRTLCEQWRIAFEIGAQNYARGARKTTVRELIMLILNNIYGFKSSEKSNLPIRELIQNPKSEIQN